MIVKNPTSNDLAVKIEGIEYVAPANGEVANVLPEHAEHWKKYIHQFIEVVSEKAKVPEVDPSMLTADSAPLKSEVHKEVPVKTPKKK